MDCAHMNHYEKQLYIVFKTFDVDNEEALEKSAVLELCDALQLEDRGATLIESLFERRSGRVTFTQFRNGLLSVLGGGDSAPLPTAAINLTQLSDDESSSREVAPKFVFGAKKYGRRSRPQHTVSEEAPRPRVASDSRLDGERSRERMRCKRSASAMESRISPPVDDQSNAITEDLDHDKRVDREHALSLCRSLQMTGIDSRLVDGVFDSVPTEEITVGDFFDRLNASLTTSIAVTTSLDGAGTASQNILANSDRTNELQDEMPSDAIVDAFERSGVRRPRRLLLELGFTAATVRPSDLERALDDELQALNASPDGQADARDFLSLALLTLLRLRVERSQQCMWGVVAERDKLRVDLAEANRRARLLAQDVDENHARIEAELKASLRQVEVRHNEAARVAAAEISREREKTAATLSHLEEEIARRADVEMRLRADVLSLCERIKDLELRAVNAEEKAQYAERERTRLTADIKAVEEASALAADASQVATSQLEATLEELRLENKILRDRNDELCAELEVVPQPSATRICPDVGVSWRDEAPLDTSLSLNDSCNEYNLLVTDQNAQCGTVETLQGILAKIQSLSLCKDGTCESCSTFAHIITSVEARVLHSGERAPALVDVQMQTDDCPGPKIVAPQDVLENMKQTHTEEKAQLMAVISELEASYEQLKMDYDKCEEYWSAKLEEEREIFNEEQRAGDERLAELVAKIGEYERQFARAPLPTIEERASLEQQVTALEEEFAVYRRDKEASLAARGDELARVKKRLEELEKRAPGREVRDVRQAAASAPSAPHRAPALTPICAPCPKCVPCGACVGCAACGAGVRAAAALRARAARAERAAQRLAARLAAADLLVKDLYLENCRLAHRPRLP